MSKKKKKNSASIQSKLNPDAKINSAAAKRFGLYTLAICVIVGFVLFAAVGFSFDYMQTAGESRDIVRELCYFGILFVLCTLVAITFMQIFWFYKRASRRRQLMKPVDQEGEGKVD